MTEDEVFEAVRQLVVAGEYLDQIAGQAQRGTEGGGTFQGAGNPAGGALCTTVGRPSTWREERRAESSRCRR